MQRGIAAAILVLVVLSSAALLEGCGNREGSDEQRAQQSTSMEATSTVEMTRQQAQEALAVLRRRAADLRTQAEKLSEDARADVVKQLDGLETQMDEIESKLETGAQEDADTAWESIKSGVKIALDRASDALSTLAEKIK